MKNELCLKSQNSLLSEIKNQDRMTTTN